MDGLDLKVYVPTYCVRKQFGKTHLIYIRNIRIAQFPPL